MDTLQRLHKLKDAYNYSDYKIAKLSGLSQATVSNLFKRNNVPNLYTLEAIVTKAFGISLSQFFAFNYDDNTLDLSVSMMSTLTSEQKELFDTWVRLEPTQRAAVIALLKTIN